MIKVLLIDDEEKARNILYYFLTTLVPEIAEVRQADSVDNAISALKEFTPDVVFLDIEMPNKNGFDFLLELNKPSFDVIFTTAYNQYAIQAIRFSALDYLLKPVDPDELKNAIQRYLDKKESTDHKEQLFNNLVQNIEQKDIKDFKIAVPSSDGVHFFVVDDILRLEADSSYTNIHLVNHRPFLASKTLKHFEERLEDFNFIRTHKSHLVNSKHITRISNDKEFVLLTDGSKVEVARRKKEEVQQQLHIK